MSGITTTFQKLGPTGRVEREVEVTEVPGDMTDAVCATCQGTGIDPDPADLDPGNDQCPECKGSGRVDPTENEPPVPPTGMGQPAIDHDKVTAAAEALNGGPFSMVQAAAVKALYRALESIREDRQALNDRKAYAKVAFQKACPDTDIVSVMIAYNIYIAAKTEAAAASQMRRVVDTVKAVAGIYQPSLF